MGKVIFKDEMYDEVETLKVGKYGMELSFHNKNTVFDSKTVMFGATGNANRVTLCSEDLSCSSVILESLALLRGVVGKVIAKKDIEVNGSVDYMNAEGEVMYNFGGVIMSSLEPKPISVVSISGRFDSIVIEGKGVLVYLEGRFSLVEANTIANIQGVIGTLDAKGDVFLTIKTSNNEVENAEKEET